MKQVEEKIIIAFYIKIKEEEKNPNIPYLFCFLPLFLLYENDMKSSGRLKLSVNQIIKPQEYCVFSFFNSLFFSK
jgi:hypothetical protein